MKRSFSTRLLEILPGALVWITLIAPFFLSFHYARWVVTFVIIFDCYWLYRSLRLAINTIRAYRLMHQWLHTDWGAKLAKHDIPQLIDGHPTVATKIAPDDIMHVVILIFYKESYELLEQSIRSYAHSHVAKDKVWLVLASEERAGEHGADIAQKARAEFGDCFGRIILSVHPANIPGEIRSKSSNATFAAKLVQRELDAMHKPYDQVIVHNFDADTRIYPKYFNAVTYTYLKSELGMPTSFQPLHIYANNIWETPALMRLIAQTSTIIFMNNMLRPSRFHHFSSRSDVFATIVKIGFWTVDAIPEDSRQYYDSYFAFHGRMRIEPIYVPLRMDAVLADGYWRTVQNQYRQLRRWAWGIVDFPYVVDLSLKDHDIPWRQKLTRILLLLESHYSWATGAITVTVIGWIPLIVNPNFGATVLGFNFPHITRFLLTLALVGLFTGVITSLLLLPPRPQHKHHLSYVGFLFQWFLSPIASIFLSSFASIDAQTRLMFGRYLEYQVTEKKVAQPNIAHIKQLEAETVETTSS